jgi:hypothetical protein
MNRNADFQHVASSSVVHVVFLLLRVRFASEEMGKGPMKQTGNCNFSALAASIDWKKAKPEQVKGKTARAIWRATLREILRNYRLNAKSKKVNEVVANPPANNIIAEQVEAPANQEAADEQIVVTLQQKWETITITQEHSKWFLANQCKLCIVHGVLEIHPLKVVPVAQFVRKRIEPQDDSHTRNAVYENCKNALRSWRFRAIPTEVIEFIMRDYKFPNGTCGPISQQHKKLRKWYLAIKKNMDRARDWNDTENTVAYDVQHQASAPAQRQAPAPTPVQRQAPAPTPVQRQAPAPTPAQRQAPTPTQRQAPTPAQRQAPAPTPAQCQAPAPVASKPRQFRAPAPID